VRRRTTLSAALAATLLLATTGCTFVAEIATLEQYDPSDGVGATIGDVQVRNMLGLSEDGERVSLIFGANNTGTENVRMTIALAEGATPAKRVRLPAGALTSFGSEGQQQIVLEGVGAQLGGLLPVYVQYGEEPGRLLQVPVMDAALSEYATLLPSPTPTPEPLAPTPTPTETAAPVDPNATADPNAPVEPAPEEEQPGSTPEEGESVDG
jgi:hypothetical protein